MKNFLIILFSLLIVRSIAGTIPVGINSEKIFAWSVWENEKGVLKHYLYVFNKTKKEVKLQIKLKKFKPVGTNFEEVKLDKEIYSTFLAPSRLTKLDYPISTDRMGFMGFIEDGKPVGILQYNLEEPQRAFVDNKYKFYTNCGVNGAKEEVWVRIESVHNPHSEISISSNIKNPNDALFVKIIHPKTDNASSYEGILDSLQQTDKSILKLDQSTASRTVKLEAELGQEKFIFVPILIQGTQNGKKGSGGSFTLPFFKE